jgi:transcriptional regulator with XRE-family HTH domain
MTDARRRGKSSATAFEVLRAFGSRIQKRRLVFGWSQSELAKRAGILAPRLSRLESGRAAPGLGELIRLHAALSMSLDELIAGEPSPQTSAQIGLRRLERSLTPDQGLFVGILLNSIASELEARSDGVVARSGRDQPSSDG